MKSVTSTDLDPVMAVVEELAASEVAEHRVTRVLNDVVCYDWRERIALQGN